MNQNLFILTCFNDKRDLVFSALYKSEEAAQEDMQKEIAGLKKVLYTEGVRESDIKVEGNLEKAIVSWGETEFFCYTISPATIDD